MICICVDVSSLSGFDGASRTGIVSQRDHVSSLEEPQESGGGVCDFSGEAARSSVSTSASDISVMINDTSDVQPVYLDELSGASRENANKEDNLLDNCGILPNNCLPCLASTVSPVERRSLSFSPPSARKKTALKLPLKWKEEHTAASKCEFASFWFYLVVLKKIHKHVVVVYEIKNREILHLSVLCMLQFLQRRYCNDL